MIRKTNGDTLTASDLSTLPSVYSGLFFVPSPADVTTRQSTVRLYLIPINGLRQLVALLGMSVKDADQACRSRYNMMIETICVEHDSENPESCLLLHIFVGEDAPDTNGYKRHCSDQLPTTIFTKTLQARSVNMTFPLSVAILEKSFHAHSITSVDVGHLVLAFGRRGSYQSREIAHSLGSICRENIILTHPAGCPLKPLARCNVRKVLFE